MKKRSGRSGFQFPTVVFVGGLIVAVLGLVLAFVALGAEDYVGAGVALLASATAFGLLSIAMMRT